MHAYGLFAQVDDFVTAHVGRNHYQVHEFGLEGTLGMVDGTNLHALSVNEGEHVEAVSRFLFAAFVELEASQAEVQLLVLAYNVFLPTVS